MKFCKHICFTFSLLIVSIFLCSHIARAQVLINCPSDFFIGEYASCGGNSFLSVKPDGSTTLDSGCLVVTTPPSPASCEISSGPTPPSNNVLVEFITNSVNLGSGSVDRLRMQEDGIPGQEENITLTPLDVVNTTTINIGARLFVNANQPLGTYYASISLQATEQ